VQPPRLARSALLLVSVAYSFGMTLTATGQVVIPALSFFVDDVGDTSDDDLTDDECRTAADFCTLRAAIEQLNATGDPTGRNEIRFDIPGLPQEKVIALGALLPEVDVRVEILGFTQSDAQENSLARTAGTNAVYTIVIDGNDLGGCLTLHGSLSVVSGLWLRNCGGSALKVGRDFVGAPTSSVTIEGNQIDGDGLAGVELTTLAENARIGGLLARHRNVIWNPDVEIDFAIRAAGPGAVIQNNYVGIDPSGTLGTERALAGISIETDAYVVDNLISDNFNGVRIHGSGNVVQGNWIGVDRTGNIARGNITGIRLEANATDNQIGGSTGAERNIISGNLGDGILVDEAGGNRFQGNWIGLRPVGTLGRGNGLAGIVIRGNDNLVGGVMPELGNLIANNDVGVSVESGTDNAILSNGIYDNRPNNTDSLGIDLGGDRAVLPNDPDDSDGGVNRGQNFPAILEAVTKFNPPETQILYSIADLDNGYYRIDFFSDVSCDRSGHGEGRYYLGTAEGFHSSGVPNLLIVLDVEAIGRVFTATATWTDPDGTPHDTSEFSPCFIIAGEDVDVSVELFVNGAVEPDVNPGDVAAIELELANTGPVAATNVVVEWLRPSGFSSWIVTPPAGTTFDPVTEQWSVPVVTSGFPLVLAVDAEVDPGGRADLSLRAEILSVSEFDTDPANDVALANLALLFGADVGIDFVVDPIGVQPGEVVTLTITADNAGPEDATGVWIEGIVPAEMTIEGTTPGVLFDDRTFAWNLGSLARTDPPEVLEVTARAAASATDGTVLTAQAAVTGLDQEEPADATDDNFRQVTFVIGDAADLVVTPLFAVSDLVEDETIFRAEIRNLGPSTATFQYRLGYPRSTSALPFGTCSFVQQRFVCESSPRTLAPGESTPVFARADIRGSSGEYSQDGRWTLEVFGSSAWDPNPGNNSTMIFATELLCFIATAAFGSPFDQNVQALRDFRDEYLLTNAPGRAFVDFYYRTSPPLAAWVARDEGRRAAARVLLSPLLVVAARPHSAAAVLAVAIVVSAWLVAQRSRIRRKSLR
jgi:uncharacterized repeat protein (TIGR01451 family)